VDQSISIDETNTCQLKFFICGRHRFERFVGVKVRVARSTFGFGFFLGQSIGIEENNTFS